MNKDVHEEMTTGADIVVRDFIIQDGVQIETLIKLAIGAHKGTQYEDQGQIVVTYRSLITTLFQLPNEHVWSVTSFVKEVPRSSNSSISLKSSEWMK